MTAITKPSQKPNQPKNVRTNGFWMWISTAICLSVFVGSIAINLCLAGNTKDMLTAKMIENTPSVSYMTTTSTSHIFQMDSDAVTLK